MASIAWKMGGKKSWAMNYVAFAIGVVVVAVLRFWESSRPWTTADILVPVGCVVVFGAVTYGLVQLMNRLWPPRLVDRDFKRRP